MKKVLLVVGPESSGTRLLTEILSAHPLIIGTSNSLKHHDILDSTWRYLEKSEIDLAKSELLQIVENYQYHQAQYILTRRSIPHASQLGEPAQYMKFPDFEQLYQLCCQLDLELTVLVLNRSPVANLVSWTLNRASTQKNLDKAMTQYHEAYRHLFRFLINTNLKFYLVSLESLFLEKQKYIQSIFSILNLPQHKISLKLKTETNLKRYKWYTENTQRI